MNSIPTRNFLSTGFGQGTFRLVTATLLVGILLGGSSLQGHEADRSLFQLGDTESLTEGESAGAPAVLSLAGHWSGSWYSCSTGHRGPLFAEFCPLSTGDYRVNFRGRFFRILPFRYSVVLHVVDQQEGVVYLQGQSYLGRLFGTFTYEATATESEFRADYRSCDDRGVFTLKKCCH